MTDVRHIDDSVAAAAVFRTLSDPYRLHMYVLVRGMCMEGDQASGTVDFSEAIEEIAIALNMSPGLAEQHLMELVRARLVLMEDDPQGRPVARVNVRLLSMVADIVSGVPHED